MAEGLRIEGEKGSGRPALRDSETLRPDTRLDSVREAEEYARKITEELGHDNYNPDEFYIDKSIIPDGWSYQWKAAAIAGKENVYHILGLRRAGWREVMTDRHPWMMPQGYTGPISIKGLVLMELPKVLTDKADYAHIRESKEALRNSEAKLYEAPANTAPRDDPSVMRAGLNKVSKDYADSRRSRDD